MLVIYIMESDLPNSVLRFQPGSNICVMAFDFGETRIGVAVGNTLLKIPHPLSTITGHNKFDKFAKIAKLIATWQPSLLVVGMPTNLDNDKQLLINSITRFRNRLQHNFKLPVDFINEDYTSSTAGAQLLEQGINGVKQKHKLDGLAACAILQAFFRD
ncbi:MAG: putative pre6S rRNA nuclease [Pseudomonadota bacterium]|nr:putative pre6S rRNA nuclease [Pseudomonadota bacterium]